MKRTYEKPTLDRRHALRADLICEGIVISDICVPNGGVNASQGSL